MKRALFIALALAVGLTATGYAQSPPRAAGAGTGPAFVDANGDGICDNFQTGNRLGAANQGKGKRFGPGDGTGHQGIGPRNGTGFGAGNGTGICDGTGPKGQASRMGRGGKR